MDIFNKLVQAAIVATVAIVVHKQYENKQSGKANWWDSARSWIHRKTADPADSDRNSDSRSHEQAFCQANGDCKALCSVIDIEVNLI